MVVVWIIVNQLSGPHREIGSVRVCVWTYQLHKLRQVMQC